MYKVYLKQAMQMLKAKQVFQHHLYNRYRSGHYDGHDTGYTILFPDWKYRTGNQP